MVQFFTNTIMLDTRDTAVERSGVAYDVIYGNGTAWVSKERVYMESETTDYGAVLDKAIDQIAERDPEMLCTIDEAEKENPYGDMYVSGGNEGLCLFHYGTLDIVLAS